jgi:hypothetical protein
MYALLQLNSVISTFKTFSHIESFISSLLLCVVQLVEKYQNFNFEPFPIVSPLFEPDKAELERHKPTLQKYFDTVCKSGEIVNDPHFRELFNLTNDILPSAVSEESQKLVQALTVMCSQMESTENTMISLFTNQIDDVFFISLLSLPLFFFIHMIISHPTDCIGNESLPRRSTNSTKK